MGVPYRRGFPVRWMSLCGGVVCRRALSGVAGVLPAFQAFFRLSGVAYRIAGRSLRGRGCRYGRVLFGVRCLGDGIGRW